MRAAARGPLPVDGHATMRPYAATSAPVLFALGLACGTSALYSALHLASC